MTKQNITHFIHTQKQKQLLLKMTFMMYLNQSILKLYQIYKNLQEKIQAGLSVLTKGDKDFGKILDFKDIKCAVKIIYINKIEKKNPLELGFLVMKTKQKKQNIFGVIVCKLLVQKNYQNVILKIDLKLMANKGL